MQWRSSGRGGNHFSHRYLKKAVSLFLRDIEPMYIFVDLCYGPTHDVDGREEYNLADDLLFFLVSSVLVSECISFVIAWSEIMIGFFSSLEHIRLPGAVTKAGFWR